MNNNTSLKSIKSGKKFSDFCFVVLFIISCAGFANHNDSINNKNIVLLTPPEFVEIRLPSFQFKKNSTDVLDSMIYYDNVYTKTLDDINTLYKIMIDNPSITFELKGHCSADEKNPDELSLQRAEKIKQLLIEKGIETDRIATKGFGIKKLKITSQQILKAKTKQEKENLNQINRRVIVNILGWDYQPKGK
jgi:outer membrane protein OmpA-like peptidoglycan-associated protein